MSSLMKKLVVAVFAVGSLAACGSPGPAYRGSPPPGMTDAEYRCKLIGEGCPQTERWPEMKEPTTAEGGPG